MSEHLNDLAIHLVKHKARQVNYWTGASYVTVQQIIDDMIYGPPGPISHHWLLDLTVDDHPQYILATGIRAFTGPVSGVFPTVGAHLATKAYADLVISTHESMYVHTDIALNTAHRLTASGNPHNVMATEISDFDIEVANNPVVADSALKAHWRQHGISSVLDHVGISGTTTGNIMVFEINGLPADSMVSINDVIQNTLHRLIIGNPHQVSYNTIVDTGTVDGGWF